MKSNKLTALIFCLGMLIQGCFLNASKEPTIVMHADTLFSPDERACMEQSAQQWRDQTNGLADAHFVYDYKTADPISYLEMKLHHRVVRWTSENPVLAEMERQGTERERLEDPDAPPYIILGMVSPGIGLHHEPQWPVEMRLVADRLQNDPNFEYMHRCKLTTIHELGHVFGLQHLENNDANIMFPSVNMGRKACLKKDDLLVFCYLNNCGNVAMKPCEDD